MATATAQITPGSYRLDPVHSSVGFSIKHLVSRFRGHFDDFDVELDVSDEGELRLTGRVPVSSVDVRDENLAAHLASPEFFDADRHPEIVFESSRVGLGADGELDLSGTLTIKGTARDVEAHGTLTFIEADLHGTERIGVDLETVIDRTAYGLDWNAPLPKGGFALGNEVTLSVEVELTRAA